MGVFQSQSSFVQSSGVGGGIVIDCFTGEDSYLSFDSLHREHQQVLSSLKHKNNYNRPLAISRNNIECSEIWKSVTNIYIYIKHHNV